MLSIVDQPLAYVDALEPRVGSALDLVVIHCTELPDLETARDYAQRLLYPSGTGNSGHYYIDRTGIVYRYVPDERNAHHTKGFNQRSIGIELVNRGRYPDWLHSDRQAMTEPYASQQIASVIDLLNWLCKQRPSLVHIAGHEDLDQTMVAASNDCSLSVRRKLDPGPLFPWAEVLSAVPLQRLAHE